MNREIKFRAWDNDSYMSNPFTLEDLQFGKIQFTKDCQIMQFTGLKDRNNNNCIYEGDIVSLHGILIGNKYENAALLKQPTNLLIKGMGTKSWIHTEQKAMERGCRYAE